MQQLAAIPNWIKLFLIALAAFAITTVAAQSGARINSDGLDLRAPTLIHKAPIFPQVVRKAPTRADIFKKRVTAPRRSSRSGVASAPPAPGRATSGRRR